MLKVVLYRLLLRAEAIFAKLTGWRAEHHRSSLESYFNQGELAQTESGQHSLVVYAGTIGEYNAISSFISAYFECWPGDNLVVLMGSRRYFEAISRARPNTNVGVLNWRSPRLHDNFIGRARPRCLVIAEAPSLYGYFPPHFELGLLVACLAHHVPAYVVNACAYELELPSRMMKIEHKLFHGLHEQAIRQWYAPSEAMAARLADMGVPQQKLTVVGNLKFDGLDARENQQGDIERTQRIDAFAKFRAGPIFVSGNVNAIDEQKVVVEAWLELRAAHANARLVVAPRYLQFAEVISELRGFLDENDINYGMWSDGAEANQISDLVILDTYGDLFHFYGIATVCYAGRNHGVLESLCQGKPTLVSAQWKESSGGFELYRRLVDADALIQVRDLTELGRMVLRVIDDTEFRQGFITRAQAAIDAEQGAGTRTFEAIRIDGEDFYGTNTSRN